MTIPPPIPPEGHPVATWRDTARPLDERVDLLVAEMSLEEKVAQLGSRWVGNDLPGGAMSSPEGPEPDRQETLNVAPMQDVFAAAGSPSLEEASRHGLGHLTRVYGSAPITAAEGAAELVRQQRIVLASSRLGIPALVHEECLTGFTTYGATVFPAAIAWGATFDPDLVERMAAAIGRDMAALGVHQGLSPVLDVVRDYRWGRVEETIGEDPYLVAMLGAAYVRGPAKRRRRSHPEALRRVLRRPRRPQPRSGADGAPGADGGDPASVRDGDQARWGRLGDELLL